MLGRPNLCRGILCTLKNRTCRWVGCLAAGKKWSLDDFIPSQQDRNMAECEVTQQQDNRGFSSDNCLHTSYKMTILKRTQDLINE